MIEQIKDANTKKAISRRVLEALRDWFEVEIRYFWQQKRVMIMWAFFA